eukprot:scaffold64838_cov39-Phaeocystis_antarctica.AAC.1
MRVAVRGKGARYAGTWACSRPSMGGEDSAGLAPWGWWVRGNACRAARLLGESEVGYLAVAVLVEQQVLRLEVAVEDRALVQ